MKMIVCKDESYREIVLVSTDISMSGIEIVSTYLEKWSDLLQKHKTRIQSWEMQFTDRVWTETLDDFNKTCISNFQRA
ncbi:MAG: hypothetical protein OH335_05030 [Candidatus Parvarchaeota archaeon]|nr:hypothetical protein [Candidatus Jingweiarchaeum tengchongense]MCW1306110.1 hypothetical protein [Candidatus Jingweiarchaeum tengchongense]